MASDKNYIYNKLKNIGKYNSQNFSVHFHFRAICQWPYSLALNRWLCQLTMTISTVFTSEKNRNWDYRVRKQEWRPSCHFRQFFGTRNFLIKASATKIKSARTILGFLSLGTSAQSRKFRARKKSDNPEKLRRRRRRSRLRPTTTPTRIIPIGFSPAKTGHKS